MAEKPFGLWSATASESISVKFDTGIALDEFFKNNTLKVTDQAEHDRKLAKLREEAHKEEHKAPQYVFDEAMPNNGTSDYLSMFMVGVRFGRDSNGLIVAVTFKPSFGSRVFPLSQPVSQHHIKTRSVFRDIYRSVEIDVRQKAYNDVFSHVGVLKSKWKQGEL